MSDKQTAIGTALIRPGIPTDTEPAKLPDKVLHCVHCQVPIKLVHQRRVTRYRHILEPADLHKIHPCTAPDCMVGEGCKGRRIQYV